MAEEQASSGAVSDGTDEAFASVMAAFEHMYGKSIRTPPALLAVALKWFNLTLGDEDATGWLHRDRWGKQGEMENDLGSAPEDPPEEGNHSASGQRQFRKHMRHLAQCMGREARHRSAGGSLTPGVLDDVIRGVMWRSREGGCRPMIPDKDCWCQPTESASPDDQPLKVRSPKVCEKIAHMLAPDVGQESR